MFTRRIWNRVTAPFQLLYWQLALPQAEGAKLLIECQAYPQDTPTFLMIRETFGQHHWTFPGGRMKSYETPEETARRKAKEEVGIILRNPEYLGSYFHTRQYKKDAICVYYARVKYSAHTPNDSSVAESRWFSLEEINKLDPRSESVDDVLELYRRHKGQ